MGLTDLREILVRREASFEELRGKHAVDAFNTLYQFLTIIRQPDGTPLMDSNGAVTSHLSGLFYRTCGFLEKGVQPIYVFDGEPSAFKKKTIAERSERKREAEEALAKAREEGRIEEAGLLAQRTARLTAEMVGESKELLSLMGLPVVQAPSEGEAECAFLCEKRLVESTCSQDFDALLFGTPVLVRNLAIAGRRKLPRRNAFIDVVPERISLKESLGALDIDRKKLVWIALLCGTDFNEGVKGIGPKKGLALAKKHSSFRAILSELGTEIDWEPIEELFLHPPAVEPKKNELVFHEPQKQKIIDFLVARDFSRERIENALARAFREPLGSEQKGLKKWF